MLRSLILVLATLTLASCTTAGEAPVVSSPPAGSSAIPYQQAGLERLLQNKGITLQWIGWNDRGPVRTRLAEGVLYLTGEQQSANGTGKLSVEGKVIEIGSNYFILDGTIRITDTPEVGRSCEADKFWHFAITQNRQYYRLREFEWCDELTDYVDIYF